MKGIIEGWLVETHLWVAAAAAGLVLFCCRALDLSHPGGPVAMVGAATLLIYRFDGWVDEDRPSRGWLPAAGSLALLLWSGSQAPVAVRWCLALGAIPCLVYGWRLPHTRGKVRCLREIPGVKPLFVTTALTVAVIGIPLLWSTSPPSHAVGASASFVVGQISAAATTALAGSSQEHRSLAGVVVVAGSLWVLLLCNVTLFDLRDCVADAARGLRTLPVLLGPGRTRLSIAIVAGLLAITLGGCLVWPSDVGLDPTTCGVLALAAAATALCAGALTPTSDRLQYAMWVDGIPLTLGLFAWLSG